MIAASNPVQRPRTAKLLVVDAAGRLTHVPRSRLVDFLRAGDVVVANDAATLPASLHGTHARTGRAIEVRLASRRSLDPADVQVFSAVVFGAGDFHTRTEDRPAPPSLRPGDRVVFGTHASSDGQPLTATIASLLDQPRLVSLGFDGSPDAIWAGLARWGRPIQYAHVPSPLALWDVWTPIAALPAAFEAPSAGFVLDWQTVREMRDRGITFVTLTLAAGISSTGDPALDGLLPLDEPYRIPLVTARAIAAAQRDRRRIVAVGTTVVRALEHAASVDGCVRAGDGVASDRVGPDSQLRIVDLILSGTHEPDSSHYQLLRAFVDEDTLARATLALEERGYRTHEFGDSVLIARERTSLKGLRYNCHCHERLNVAAVVAQPF